MRGAGRRRGRRKKVRIKRFVAPDMRTALRMVREEQGPDAVILSNRPAEGGIDIVAATDYDESLVQQALRAAAPMLEPHSAPVVALHAPRSPARERIAHIEPIHAPALVTEAAANAPALAGTRAANGPRRHRRPRTRGIPHRRGPGAAGQNRNRGADAGAADQSHSGGYPP